MGNNTYAAGRPIPTESEEENIMTKKKKTSIMLTDHDKKLLELLAKKENRSQTKELEYLIRRRAEELGLKIKEQ
jgi:hypothetical protein